SAGSRPRRRPRRRLRLRASPPKRPSASAARPRKPPRFSPSSRRRAATSATPRARRARPASARPSSRSSLLPRALAAGDLGGERVEPDLPEAAEALDPLVDLLERGYIDGIDATRPFTAHVRKAALAQHLEVLRHRRLADAEFGLDHLDDLARRVLAFRQQFENAAANGIAEDVEGVHQVSPQ